MEVSFRPSRYGDIAAIAPRMSDIEKIECAWFGRTPKAALRLGLKASVECMTGLVDGRPEAMFGVSPVSLMDGIGCPWFLGTDRARARSRPFLELAPGFLDHMSGLFPRLENVVHRDNVRSIRWLRKLGFTVFEEPSEPSDTGPMRRFRRGF